MAEDNDIGGTAQEEIQGAPPPALSTGTEQRGGGFPDAATVNLQLQRQAEQLELMLLESPHLLALLEVMLVSMPRHFGLQVSELWLHDPEQQLVDLIVGGERYGRQLQLRSDVFPLQELYSLEPDVVLIDATDLRMFEVLKTEDGIDHALLMPLMDDGRLIGSFHCGYSDDSFIAGPAEEDIFVHLASVISLCLKNSISRQQIAQLCLLDPLTKTSNPRGFELHIAREISRAKRMDQPVALMVIEIDEFEDLSGHYGDLTGQFIVKKVAQRVSSSLRATDYMARFNGAKMALLYPGIGEVMGLELANRTRDDIENFSIDDGRGGVMCVTLSIGIVSWEPNQYPAVDMGQLAKQMQTVGNAGLATAQSKGGNCAVVAHLNTMIV